MVFLFVVSQLEPLQLARPCCTVRFEVRLNGQSRFKKIASYDPLH